MTTHMPFSLNRPGLANQALRMDDSSVPAVTDIKIGSDITVKFAEGDEVTMTVNIITERTHGVVATEIFGNVERDGHKYGVKLRCNINGEWFLSQVGMPFQIGLVPVVFN